MRIYSLIALVIAALPAVGQAPVRESGADVVPTTAFGFVTIRTSDLRDVEALKPVREAIARLEKSEGSLERHLGVPLDDIDRLTLLWPSAPTDSPLPYIVVTTKAPLNEAKVLKVLKALPAEHAMRRHRGVFGAGAAATPLPTTTPDPSRKEEYDPLAPPKAPPAPPPLPPKKFEGPNAQAGDPPPVTTKGPPRRPANEVVTTEADLFLRDTDPYAAVFILDNRTLLHIPMLGDGPVDVLKFLGQVLRHKNDGPLAEALALAGKHTIVAGAQVAAIEHLLSRDGDFPRDLVPYRILLKAQTITVVADVAAKTTITAKLAFPDAATARRAEPVFKTLLQHGVEALAELRKEAAQNAEINAVLAPLLELASHALDKADIRTDGTLVSAHIDTELGPTVTKALAALPELIEFLNTKQKTLNNLKQIGLAIHNYHDTYGHLPVNIVGQDGKLLMSWRVAILPFIEQDAMWRQLNMDKPWNDPANAKVLAKMPEVFRVFGRDAEKGKTYFQMPYSAKAPVGGSPFLVAGRKAKIFEVVDGLTNTLMVVEAADAVDWAKPDDVLFDPKKLPALGSKERKWFYSLFGDGRVQAIDRSKLTDEQLRALLTTNGGEEFRLPD